jgi:hypothetical protein
MKLYWVTTDFHEEDWFVLAQNAEAAARFHEDAEGYERGDAVAEEVMDIPDEIPVERGWPPPDLLKTLGAKMIYSDLSRVVELSGRTFCEGLMDAAIYTITDNVFELLGRGRPNQTPKK